jgi:hypothetical protein
VQKLDEAIKVIGGLEKSSADASARDRIYTCAMVFAEKLARDKNADNDTLATGLYDRAAKAASSAQQQVNYRISRARFVEKSDDAMELKLLQEILSDSAWRAVPVAQGDSGGPTQAAAVAENMISEVIARNAQTYASVAEQAEAAFKSAQASADPAKLLSVAQTYPNARIAPQAMLKAADAYEAVGNPRQAVQVLRQLYFKYPLVPYRAAVIESLARNYLATPNHMDVAIARLTQGAKLPGNPALTRPLMLPDGQVIKDVSFADALAALRKYHEQATMRALPDFSLPPPSNQRNPKGFIRPTDPIATRIMAIVQPLREFARNDRVVTFTPGVGVSVFAVGSTEPLANAKAITEIPTNCAWVGDTLLVWSISKIVMIKPDGSSPLWETELRTIPVVEVATRDDDQRGDAETAMPDNGIIVNNGVIIVNGQRIVRRGNALFRIQMQARPREVAAVPAGNEQIWKVALVSDRVIIATSGGRIISLDLADGKTIWQMRPSDRPVDRLMASDDFVVGQMNDGMQVRLVALDTFSGQLIMHKEYPLEGISLVNLALASDGKLVTLLLDRIECKDLFEPGDKPTFSIQVKRNDQNGGAFANSAGPEQLILSEGRAIAISEEGRFIRVYSLENGQPLHGGRGGDGGSGEMIDNAPGLQTQRPEGSADQVALFAVGSRVYAVGSGSIVGYNLDQPGDAWHDHFGDDVMRQALMGKDFLLVVCEKAVTNRPPFRRQFPATMMLRAYSRAILENTGRESGRMDYQDPLASPTGIQSWQAVDGGLYYLTGDQKLFFLKGGRQ